jgi:hypothetical protein
MQTQSSRERKGMEGKLDEKLTVDEEASASSWKRGHEQAGNASR